MERRIKIEICIDYNKLMHKNSIQPIDKGYCSEEEEECVNKLINSLHTAIPLAKEVGYCIEEFRKKTIKEFERSSKMGSSLSKHIYYK